MAKPFRKKGRDNKEKSEFDQYILDLARVTRVTGGGKQLSFRACVVLGNRKGKVGFGVAKGKDVQIAVEKAVKQGRKKMIEVQIVDETLPHTLIHKFKASTVLLKPAPKGSGVIAGGPVRVMMELAGVPNVSAKILGKTKNKISIVKSVFEALQSFKKPGPDQIKERQEKENREKGKINE
ncbi:MAG: 30S ribosomal protein S5 [Candidatus Magasanikbacteria bacterium CG10_big_fil_rev_8_21_14_0_10_40_10]|uniref:Small ribosomal subunit protein uS5 n=1 Tax=Candidatus Magasanikbacteria bacterium CG10_big_fil_rev_8_21_14_0_10_40_10 TaxID=1974648 RepID=A0A2M6W5A7_9BACT|nr:MAG: 30S ribosomal protein S5 [Candidatus Magasanikbacteria bacterium CG10_big_fil_rev_8_21_14_0_10_40_10]